MNVHYNAPMARQIVTVEAEVMAGVMDLLGRYPQAVDLRDYSAWADLFESDGLFTFEDKAIKGREALRDYVSQSPRGVHISSLPFVTVESGEAKSVSSFLYHYADTGVLLSGYYHDRINITERPYRFAVRRVDVVGRT
jgi:SnoaL-like domain